MIYNELKNNIHFLIPSQKELGVRIDKYIARQICNISRTRVKALIESNSLSNKGSIINNCSYITKENDSYKLIIPDIEKNTIIPKDIILDIIYEDDDLLVINKQSGMTVHPGSGNHDDTLVNALLSYLKDNLSSIGGVERPGIVHRLDKDTSGLIVIAKNDFTHLALSKQLASRELNRIYFALIWGVPEVPNKVIITNIAKNRRDRTKMIVVKSGGREAITNYKVVESYKNQISQIECKLSTGRTHQIRVHLAHIKHPIIGDQKYGSGKLRNLINFPNSTQDIITKFDRQALHAKKIGFIHPRTVQYLEFKADIPEDLKILVDSLSN